MPADTPRGMVEIFDDFLGDTLNGDLYVSTVSAGGTVAITGVEQDGTVQLDTDATDGDAAQLSGNLNWRVQDGILGVEMRANLDVITTVGLFIGFTDATSETDLIPMTLSGTTFTTTATTAAGLLFDTDATNDDWHAFWVDDDNDTPEAIANLRFTGVAPIADTFATYRVVLYDQGAGNPAVAEFTIVDNLGRSYQKRFTTNIDRDAVLTPYIGHENHGAFAHETTVDYFYAWKSRGG